MPRSKPANHTSRILLFASDSKNSVLAEMAGSIHRLAYSPYGQQSSRQKVMAHLGFNGELREPTSGWYLLGNGHRAYNPQLMRFHSPVKLSPFGRGGLNTYMYCGGEPVMNVDPTGRSFWSRALKIWDFFHCPILQAVREETRYQHQSNPDEGDFGKLQTPLLQPHRGLLPSLAPKKEEENVNMPNRPGRSPETLLVLPASSSPAHFEIQLR